MNAGFIIHRCVKLWIGSSCILNVRLSATEFMTVNHFPLQTAPQTETEPVRSSQLHRTQVWSGACLICYWIHLAWGFHPASLHSGAGSMQCRLHLVLNSSGRGLWLGLDPPGTFYVWFSTLELEWQIKYFELWTLRGSFGSLQDRYTKIWILRGLDQNCLMVIIVISIYIIYR